MAKKKSKQSVVPRQLTPLEKLLQAKQGLKKSVLMSTLTQPSAVQEVQWNNDVIQRYAEEQDRISKAILSNFDDPMSADEFVRATRSLPPHIRTHLQLQMLKNKPILRAIHGLKTALPTQQQQVAQNLPPPPPPPLPQ